MNPKNIPKNSVKHTSSSHKKKITNFKSYLKNHLLFPTQDLNYNYVK